MQHEVCPNGKKNTAKNYKKNMKRKNKEKSKWMCTSKPIARGKAAAKSGPWTRNKTRAYLPELAVPKTKTIDTKKPLAA
jgi:hypothetical protein